MWAICRAFVGLLLLGLAASSAHAQVGFAQQNYALLSPGMQGRVDRSTVAVSGGLRYSAQTGAP